MLIESYPQFVIFAVLGLGIPLAVVKPYKVFLLSVLLLTAGNAEIFNQTRTSLLGPYLNLNDACLLVAMTALFFDKFLSKKPLRLPQVIPLLLVVLTIGACQSFWKLGWTYETARAYRWALQLPVVFFIGANFITSPARAKKLLVVLLCGAILAAIQHLFFVFTVWRSMSLNMQTYKIMRTIAYVAGGMASAFLVAGAIWKLPASIRKRIAFLMVGGLFLASLFLSQTRSLWIATAGAVPFLLFFFQRRRYAISIMRIGVIVILLIFTVGWVCQRAMPRLNVFNMAADRIELFFRSDTQKVHIGTRERAFKVEMNYWLKGTLVFGRGLYFFQTIENPENYNRRIAFNHLGYVTYLSQLGLIGLLIYGFYLPLSVFRDGCRLWRHGELPVIRYIGLLGTASIVCLSILFLMSSSFLNSGCSSPGVLYGALWSLARIQRRELFDKYAVWKGQFDIRQER